MKKITNEEIDFLIKDKFFIRLENYLGWEKKIKFQCVKDNYIWNVLPYSIIHKNIPCPSCSGRIPITNVIIDKKLENRPIKRLGNYKTIHTKIKWQCLQNNCLFIWKAQPNDVINDGTGCPKCSGLIKLTNKDIDIKLGIRQIKRISNYKNANTPIWWQCLIDNCNYKWKTTPASVINTNTGCPKCSDNAKYTNKTVDLKLFGRNIKRIGNVKNKKIKWECLIKECNCSWMATVHDIMGGNGCPLCKNKNEKLIFKLLYANDIGFEHQKHLKYLGLSKNNRYKIDFYIPSINLIIEYNGEQHYNPVCFGGISKDIAISNLEKQKNRDLYLIDFCYENSINLMVINGIKLNKTKLEKFMIEVFLPWIKMQKAEKLGVKLLSEDDLMKMMGN